MADEYLRKYYLPRNEYIDRWKPIQNSIFLNETQGLPDMIFQPEFSLLVARGGRLFDKEDFEALRSCMIDLGDKHMIIVQNDYNGIIEQDLLIRMKFPVDITWNEVMSGNYISTVIFEMFANGFFVFSESGIWGKYSDNEYENPLDIFGVREEFLPILKKHFKQAREEQEELFTWLPDSYQRLMCCPE